MEIMTVADLNDITPYAAISAVSDAVFSTPCPEKKVPLYFLP